VYSSYNIFLKIVISKPDLYDLDFSDTEIIYYMVVVMMSKLHEVYVLAVASNDLDKECADFKAVS
jgi:hypothetical protein